MKSVLKQTTYSSDRLATSVQSPGSSLSFCGQPTKGLSGRHEITVGSPKEGGRKFAQEKRKLSKLRSTKPSKRLRRLRNKAYRSAAAEENATTRIALQIRLMRERAGLTQAELAERIGTKQSAIARLESMAYGKFSFSMLQKVAGALDVVAWVEFVSFSTFIRRTADLSPESLAAEPYFEEFDENGDPLAELQLAFDGSALCQSHYLSAKVSPGSTSWAVDPVKSSNRYTQIPSS